MKALVAILGLDSHWRGSVMVARVLREMGLEVVYLGNQFPHQIAASALQEDPDLIAVSSLSGSHGTLVPEIMRLLREHGLAHVPMIVGGAIPPSDVPILRAAGVAEVFGPGRPLDDLIACVRRLDERGARPGSGGSAGAARSATGWSAATTAPGRASPAGAPPCDLSSE